MKNNLIPEVRADKDGRLVTRHVLADKGAAGSGKSFPSPSLSTAPQPRKRRAYKPTEAQLMSAMYGIAVNQPDPDNWGPHVIGEPHPDLKAVPFIKDKQERFHGNWYRFNANDVEYYSVMSVVRPFDAINLLHRGVRSADEALEFLSENGLDHLASDHSAYTDELLRQRIGGNMGMVLLNDIIDFGGDPVLAGEWAKMCSQKSIIDKAVAIKDEMLSGAVTMKDLKYVGIKNLAVDIKAVAEAIIHSKTDNNPDFTLDSIAYVAESETTRFAAMVDRRWADDTPKENSMAARLGVARVLGERVASNYSLDRGMFDYALKQMDASGSVDPERLAKLTVFSTDVAVRPYSDEDYAAMVELFDAGADVSRVNDFIGKLDRSVPTKDKLVGAKEGLHAAVESGWL